MPRVKRGVTARARHKKVLALAKGFRGRRGNVFRIAKQAVMKAGQYAYRDRRTKKRVFRQLWIARINAGVARTGPDLQPVRQRHPQGRHRDRPQGPGRYRRARQGRFCRHRGAGQGQAGCLIPHSRLPSSGQRPAPTAQGLALERAPALFSFHLEIIPNERAGLPGRHRTCCLRRSAPGPGRPGERQGAVPRQGRPHHRADEGHGRAVASTRRRRAARRSTWPSRPSKPRSPSAARHWPTRSCSASCKAEALDVTLPGRLRAPGGLHPVSRTMERIEADLREHGLRRRRRPRDRERLAQLHLAEQPAEPSGALDAGHLLRRHQRRRRHPLQPAPAHQPDAGALCASAHQEVRGAVRSRSADQRHGNARDPRDRARAAPTASTATPPTRRCSTSAKACGSART